MADRVVPGPIKGSANIREAVCINTRKIFDSCRDKDCVEDLRVYPTCTSQSYIENALSIRPKNAELLYVDVNVAPVTFNKGYYTIDCSYFYRVTSEAFPGGQSCVGLAVFDKRVMLFGSEGKVKSYSSKKIKPIACIDELPTAIVTSVDPVCLHAKLVDSDCPIPTDAEQRPIPEYISSSFQEKLVTNEGSRRWLVTLGQFSIIRLERDTQLLIPAYDYCMPDKECPGAGCDQDPCSLFTKIRFPVDEFFPPDTMSQCDDYRSFASSAGN
ncbi:MAG: hypothetical protein ACOX68_01780 [Candidatus Limivicinus sp.]|jgi:hypothetical protein